MHMEFKTLSGRVFSEQQAIDLLVSLMASDANSGEEVARVLQLTIPC